MPEWFTPLLRVLVAIPSFGYCSTRNTSCHRFETALAIAHPITPPPIIRMLAWSMNSEYRKWKKEKRELLARNSYLRLRTIHSAASTFGTQHSQDTAM